jgi:hypothetical protein
VTASSSPIHAASPPRSAICSMPERARPRPARQGS